MGVQLWTPFIPLNTILSLSIRGISVGLQIETVKQQETLVSRRAMYVWSGFSFRVWASFSGIYYFLELSRDLHKSKVNPAVSGQQWESCKFLIKIWCTAVQETPVSHPIKVLLKHPEHHDSIVLNGFIGGHQSGAPFSLGQSVKFFAVSGPVE